jgi:flagellar biosynthesis/type III secretory pathway protein FliH
MTTNTQATEVADELVAEVAAVAKTRVPAEAPNASMAQRYLRLAQSTTITTDEEYQLAGDTLGKITDRMRAMEDERVELVKPLNDVVRKLNARFMPHINMLDEAKKLLGRTMGAYSAAVAKKAEEARLAAERAAAEQRAAAQREADAKREAAEAEARKLAEAGNEEAAQQARVKAEHEAQALEHAATTVIAQPVATVAPKVSGMSTRKVVDYEITDKVAFLRWIMSVRPDLIEAVTLDPAKVRAFVKIAGVKTVAPGLRVFENASTTVRR